VSLKKKGHQGDLKKCNKRIRWQGGLRLTGKRWL
jgi:hypothetical protein